MLENFPSYMKKAVEDKHGILEEQNKQKYHKKVVYSADALRYVLLLRYASLYAYKVLKEMKLPSLRLLRKLTSGKN